MKRKFIIFISCFLLLSCIVGAIKIEPKIHNKITQIKDSGKRPILTYCSKE